MKPEEQLRSSERYGHQACASCAGMGFTRRGAFADAAYSRCDACNGAGQHYVAATGDDA